MGAKIQRNRVLQCVARACTCCLGCLEKCIKFLSRHAYIQVALLGQGFCTSAWNAYGLICRNILRFGILSGLGRVTNIIGKLLITASTAVLGFLILQGMHPQIGSPYLLVFIYGVLGYLSGSLFINVFGIAVDTMLQCFIATEEMKIDSSFVPAKLKAFVDSHEAKGGAQGQQ